MYKTITIVCLALSSAIYAQNNTWQQQYREKVKIYNQDRKAASLAVDMQNEMVKSAKTDFLPKLSGGANFQHVGNPLELSVSIPDMATPVTFQGRDLKYGASLTLAQPIYTGGAIKASYEKAKKESEMARHEEERITNNILYDADVYYWNHVAQSEMVSVAEEFRSSVARLVDVVRHRVSEEYTDKNDLLMAEVKLNDAEYRLLQAKNNSEVARLSMNSFAGIPSDTILATDKEVIAISHNEIPAVDAMNSMYLRPELKIAANQVDIQKSAAKIANSQFKPKFSVGIDGSYSSPGYNFKADLDPNYAVYAKLSVPIFEWGKRKSTRRTGQARVNIARENESKVNDRIRLEIETAYYNYTEAVKLVELTENSLSKAAESETLAMEKYREGSISIVEAINAQLYHQEAKVNFIQSKLNAQIAKSAYYRAIARIGSNS